MKTSYVLKSLMPILLVLCAPAFADTETGNGNSRAVFEFGQMAAKATEHLRNTPALLPSIDRDVFERTVLNLRILPIEGATSIPCNIAGTTQQVTACSNSTTQTVELAEAAWNELPRFGITGKLQLAIHETLGLMNIRDGSGAASGQIANSLLRAVLEPYLGYWCRGRNATRVTRSNNPDQLSTLSGHRRNLHGVTEGLWELQPDMDAYHMTYEPLTSQIIYINSQGNLVVYGSEYERCSQRKAKRRLH